MGRPDGKLDRPVNQIFGAINTSPAVYQKLNMEVVNLPALQAEVGENVQGRPGGAEGA